jgi:hypothetical protein
MADLSKADLDYIEDVLASDEKLYRAYDRIVEVVGTSSGPNRAQARHGRRGSREKAGTCAALPRRTVRCG